MYVRMAKFFDGDEMPYGAMVIVLGLGSTGFSFWGKRTGLVLIIHLYWFLSDLLCVISSIFLSIPFPDRYIEVLERSKSSSTLDVALAYCNPNPNDFELLVFSARFFVSMM